MRLVINLLLVAIVGLMVYLLINSINIPIRFRAEKAKREAAVAAKLKDIRAAQEMHREIYKIYAPDFNTLSNNLKTGRLAFIRVMGDPDNPDADITDFTYDTTYVSAIDSIRSLHINLDSLAYVPYTNGVQFTMEADTITYQKTTTPVLQVGTVRKNFMGEYADAKFSKYDTKYDPNSMIKFGDLYAPNLHGNWE